MKRVIGACLGIAAIAAITGAQASDLPDKAKPVQYVKVSSLLLGAGYMSFASFEMQGAGFEISMGAASGYVDKATFYSATFNNATGDMSTLTAINKIKIDFNVQQAMLSSEPILGIEGKWPGLTYLMGNQSASDVGFIKKESAVFGPSWVARAQMAMSAYTRNEQIAGFASPSTARVATDKGTV